jgi:hypothetical protein
MDFVAIAAMVQSAIVSVANADESEEEARNLLANILLVEDTHSVADLDVKEQLSAKDAEIAVRR